VTFDTEYGRVGLAICFGKYFYPPAPANHLLATSFRCSHHVGQICEFRSVGLVVSHCLGGWCPSCSLVPFYASRSSQELSTFCHWSQLERWQGLTLPFLHPLIVFLSLSPQYMCSHMIGMGMDVQRSSVLKVKCSQHQGRFMVLRLCLLIFLFKRNKVNKISCTNFQHASGLTSHLIALARHLAERVRELAV